MGISKRKVDLTKYWFILPAVLVVLILLFYPVISTIFYSFTSKHLVKPNFEIVGLKNYSKVLSDSEFWSSLLNSIKWVIFSLIGQLLIGFTAALALNKIGHLKGLFRVLLIIPWAFPTIVIAMVWKYLLNGVSGFIPNLLVQLGICKSIPQFFTSSQLAFPTLVFINIWFGTPLIMVNVLSALQTVPMDQYEAAEIDGATSWQAFWAITFPHVRNVIGLLVVLRTIWIFNAFDIVYLVTGGGPAKLTQTLPIYAYNIGWGLKMLGRSSAVTVLLLIFLLIVCTFYFKILDKWERQTE